MRAPAEAIALWDAVLEQASDDPRALAFAYLARGLLRGASGNAEGSQLDTHAALACMRASLGGMCCSAWCLGTNVSSRRRKRYRGADA